MSQRLYDEQRGQIVKVARQLIDRHITSKSLHGNISVRVPGTDHLVMTGSQLAGLAEDDLAVIDLDDNVLDGHVAPTEFEVIAMHTAVYRERGGVHCVIHTHSPAASAFAVASRPLPVFAESLARWGVTTETPVAGWAPRGSQESVTNIVDALRTEPAAEAVLLENHGVLVGGEDANQALRRSIALEENAELGILAERLGGARAMTKAQAEAAVARKKQFLDAAGS